MRSRKISDLVTRLSNNIYRKIWTRSDDAIHKTVKLKEVYKNAPEGIANTPIEVLEIHIYRGPNREEAMRWVNKNTITPIKIA